MDEVAAAEALEEEVEVEEALEEVEVEEVEALEGGEVETAEEEVEDFEGEEEDVEEEAGLGIMDHQRRLLVRSFSIRLFCLPSVIVSVLFVMQCHTQ